MPDGQWLRLFVTTKDPEHLLHLGKGHPGDAFSGFTAQTAGDVWLEARESGQRSPDGGGTFTVQSVGQSWLSAGEGPLAFVAKKNVVFGTDAGSKSGLVLAAAGSLKMVTSREVEAGEADAADPSKETEAEIGAEEALEGWETWWTTFDSATVLALNGFDVAMSVALTGFPFPGPGLEAFTAPIEAAANFAAAAVGVEAMIDAARGNETPSALVLSGEAGLAIGSPISVNIAAGPGALVGSAFTTVFGGVSTSVVGGLAAGIASVGPVDVSAVVTASVAGGSAVELAARRGPFVADGTLGTTVQGGAVEARAMGTLDVGATSWLGLVAPKGKVAFRAAAGVEVGVGLALAMTLFSPPDPGEAVEEADPEEPVPPVIAEMPFIEINPAGAKMGLLLGAGKPLLKITADSVLLMVGAPGPGSSLSVSATGTATIAGGKHSMELGTDEAIFDGDSVKL